MFYLLPNMPPIMENTAEDEVTIAMVEFEKKRSLQRYSRYGSTVSQNDAENNKLASTLLKTVDNNISGNESNSDYNNLANKMVCAKRIQYAAGFITIISIIIVLILTTINSGDEPNLAPHSPQHGHSSKSSPSSLGFDAATGDIIYDNIDINEEEENIIDDEPQVIDDKENIIEEKTIDQEKEQNEQNEQNDQNEFDNAVFGIDNINAMKDVDYNENENNLNDDNNNDNDNDDDNEIENNDLSDNENDNTDQNKNENNIEQNNDDELNNIVEDGNDEQGAEQADKQSVAQANEEADEADDDDGELGDDYGFIADRYDEGMDDDRSS